MTPIRRAAEPGSSGARDWRRATRPAPAALAAPAAPAARAVPVATPPGVEDEARACLLRRLDRAAAQPSYESMAALRAVVTDLVDRLARRGASLDDVVSTVERLVEERGRARAPLALHVAGAPRPAGGDDALRRRLVAWCARAYRDDAWW